MGFHATNQILASTKSNKLILSKFGVFVEKLYDSGGFFHLSSLSTHSSYFVNVVCNNDMVN